ncbi:MAG: preATP grasp domain-containing protein [Roseovarius sp.]
MKRAIEAAEPIIEDLVSRLVRDEPAFGSSLEFGGMVRQGAPQDPGLVICDQSGTELFELEAVGKLEHRMALLANAGDTIVVRRRVPEFEQYLADYLGIQDVSFVETGPRNTEPVEQQLRVNPKLASLLSDALPKGTALKLQSYLTTGHTWHLAKALADCRQRPVSVAGPAPRVSKQANNKLWFSSVVRALTGKDSTPPTLYAFGPAAAAAKVSRFARQFSSVVVKVPSSAGGRGNLRLQSVQLEEMRLSDIRELIEHRLRAVGWRGTYPILVGVWESGITASPSAQMWLPKEGDGPPQILGLFEQRVEGSRGKFSGAHPADLPDDIAQEFVAEAAVIGALLQRIGYFGACSLDAVVRQSGSGINELHWVEANARWSGVSIPLAVARNLRGEPPQNGLLIVQDISPELTPIGTLALVELLDGIAFKAGASEEGIVILSPPDRAEGISLNAMALANSQARATAIVEEVRQRLGLRTS